MSRRVHIFGISGATWTMMDPLLQAGELPAIASLIARGCRGTLSSVRVGDDKHFRPQIAWPTIATGVEPNHHGVTRFFHTADDLLVPTLWDRFQEAGLTVGLFGWPITWPVRPIKGFNIPGYDGRDSTTWPAEYGFIRELDRRQKAVRRKGNALGKLPFSESVGLISKLVRGGVRASSFLGLLRDAADIGIRAPDELRPLLLRHARLKISTDIFANLFQRHQPDFSAFVTFLVDYASHRFWLFHEPQRFADAPATIPPRLRSALPDAYRAVDRALGRILKTLGPEAIVAVLSEHGMAAEEISTEIGPWHFILQPGTIKEFVGLDASMPAVPVARWIAFRPPAEKFQEVATRLSEVRLEGTNVPLFQIDLHRGEVILKLALWRDVLRGREELESLRVSYGDRTIPFTELARRFGRRRSAMHAEDGILILAGDGIRHGRLDRARLIDVALTLLKGIGIDRTDGLEGTVLDVF